MKSKFRTSSTRNFALTSAIAALLAAPQLHAATRVWGNAAGGDWFTAANWTGGMPVAADTAMFNTATGNVTVGSAGAATGYITYDSLSSGFTLGAVGGNPITFNNTGNISFLNTLVGTGKTFTIAAPLVLLPASSTAAGTFTIQNNSVSTSNTAHFSGGISSAATTAALQLNLAGNNGINLISGNISNGGAAAFNIIKSGAGTWKLTGTNTYTGATSSTAGTLIFAGAQALPATGSLGLGAGTLSILNDGAGSNGTISLGKNIALSAGGTLNVGTNGSANSGNTVAFGTISSPVAPTNTTTTFTAGNGYRMTFTGLALPGGTGNKTFLNPTTTSIAIKGEVTNQMAGFGTTNYDPLTLTGTTDGNSISGPIKDAVGGAAANGGTPAVGGWTQIIKTGTGSWTLSGANTYTGSTEVFEGGPLVLDFSAPGAPAANIINSSINSSALYLGGTLEIKGASAATNSQRFNGTTLTANSAASLNFTQNGAASLSGTLGAMVRNAQSTLDVTLPVSGSLTTTSAAFAANGLLASPTAAFATANGGRSWLGNVDGTLAAYTGYASGVASYLPENNVDVTNGDTVADVTVNTLRFNSPSTKLTLSGSNVLASGGILVTPTATSASITGGTITGKGLIGSEVILINNGSLNLGSEITNSGDGFATALTLAGGGTTTLSGTSSHTGTTNLSSGTLAITGTVAGSAIRVGSTAVLTQSAAGSITDGSSLTYASSRSSVLAGTNTYYGGTNVNAGSLTFAGPAALPYGNLSIGAGTASILNDGEVGSDTIELGKSIYLSAMGGTFHVGNNGGPSNNKTVVLGDLVAPGASTQTSTTFTAGNGYRLKFTGMSLVGGAGQTTAISPMTTSITIDGPVFNPMTVLSGNNRDTLELGGTSSGNSITGPISNSFSYNPATPTTGITGITKTGTSIWTLSGENTYTGNTNVADGVLKNGGATVFTDKGPLQVSGTGTFDLNGFPATFTNLTGSAGSVITNNGGSDVTLHISAPANVGVASQIHDGPTHKLAVTMTNNNNNGSLVVFSIPSTFSGGLTLLDGAAIGNGTRLKIWQNPTTVGAAGNLVSGPFGTGPITVGKAPTDKAGIWLSDVNNITLLNDLVINTALGTDFRGIRVVGTGHVFGGTITANLADATFITTNNLTASISLTGKVTGASGLTLDTFHVTGASNLTVTLQNPAGTNDYSGTTRIMKAASSNFILSLGAAGQIPNGTGKGDVVNDGTIALNGFSETINGLSGTGIIDGMSGTPTLTVGDNNATDQVFTGTIRNTAGTLSVTKIGSGTQTLSGTSTYSGNTTISAGKLVIAGNTSATLADTSTVTIASGAVLDLPNPETDTVARLVINGTALPEGIYDSSTPATSGYLTGSGRIQVGGTPVSGYQTWADANAGGAAANADTDLDGVRNGVEYFLNAASGFTANPAVVTNGAVRTITWPNGGNIPSSAYGSAFVIQTSSDLRTWADVPSNDPKLNNATGSVSYTFPSGSSKTFVRLSVTPD
ncbi:autotransporter-associated beta strand repeat-containing protein [Luteolibacter yonseiensis]|uniref:Autotransporter-associated beta strand repeat-containing protein n=1 Tax=Luteolibacter yonseiensis TaxID=1144680 RepID=A0A934R4Y5_9BACT|nr:autotransporter-associated beta strand repeat-containing protein [Luteolibacter yonseiensis]MBK1817032.1 autotransporter-associated beta strand repeat-containing protein [Luteolibacter yonseiensis]